MQYLQSVAQMRFSRVRNDAMRIAELIMTDEAYDAFKAQRENIKRHQKALKVKKAQLKVQAAQQKLSKAQRA